MLNKLHILSLAVTTLVGMSAHAQATQKSGIFDPFMKHLDLGVSVGSTGAGVELGAPITNWLSARIGVGYVPRFNIPMTFGLETFDTGGFNTGKFAQMQELMKEYTGIEVDDKVHMNAKCTMVDFKFLLDFKPIPGNDHWRLTAGFYYGTSKVGHIENMIYEMPTLVGVTVYNKLYDFFVEGKYMDFEINDIYPIDPPTGEQIAHKFVEYGRVGVHLGEFKNTTEYWEAGKSYIMEPDKDCMVQANMKVNRFKPYLGAGYTTNLSADKRWHFGIDVGALFWGGTPSVITHDNLNYAKEADGKTVIPAVDLSKDVSGVHGKVGNYLSLAKALKVYPVLNVKFSYTIF